jgi:rhodanese-related sulfurtransferase
MSAVTIDELLEEARRGVRRMSPTEALVAQRGGALLVDHRSEAQRRCDGEIPGALILCLTVLEWRLDPTGTARIPEAVGHDLPVVLLCNEGYSSSLAAARLRRLGLHRATDVIGGFQGWRATGLPIVASLTPAERYSPGARFRSYVDAPA